MGAGMSVRRLQPQIEPGEEGDTSPAAPESLPFNDDLLREILTRLPPLPSSLPRVSAVCKHWRGLVTDPRFHRQFHAHHRKPPLLGFFVRSDEEIVFNPVMDPPDRIPPRCFDLVRYRGSGSQALLDCRHGRFLIINRVRKEIAVCDPITGEHHRVSVPSHFSVAFLYGAVLCAAGDLVHVQGGCHSTPFKVVLGYLCMRPWGSRHITCVYSSETSVWGNLTSTEAQCVVPGTPSVLVGNCLYWLSAIGDDILEFDLDEASLTVTRGPPATTGISSVKRQIIQPEDGTVGYAMISYPQLQTWQRNVSGHGVVTWVPWRTIQLDTMLGLPHQIEGEMGGKETIQGYDEDTDVIFLRVNRSIYMVQLKSMQFRNLYKTIDAYKYYPFKSFYTAAIHECDEADMKHNP